MKSAVPAVFLCFGAVLLAGCAQNSSLESRVAQAPRAILASYLSARAFDSAQVALRQNDLAKLRRAAQDLRLAGSQSGNTRLGAALAQMVSSDAAQHEQTAASLPLEARAKRRDEAAQKYRMALAALPDDFQKLWETQLDRDTYNTLGYFLAERGQNRRDFQMAEFLTSASLARWDELLAQIGVDDARWAGAQYVRAVTAGDSHAWALFRLGRYAEAEKTMREVLNTTSQFGPQLGQQLSPELPFHMAEILRAQGDFDVAENYYQQALELSPDAELRARIESILNGKIG